MEVSHVINSTPTTESLSVAVFVYQSWFVRKFVGFFKQRQRPLLLYGGAARDLILKGASVKPRDFDFVVDSDMIAEVETAFGNQIVGRSRFGGLRLKWRNINIDCWPLDSTWAFQKGGLACTSWRDLAQASILDVDGIVVRIAEQMELETGPFEKARRSRAIGVCHHSTMNRTIALFRAISLGAKYQFHLSEGFLSSFANIDICFEADLFCSLVHRRYANEDPRAFLAYGLSSVPTSFCKVRRVLLELHANLDHHRCQLELEF